MDRATINDVHLIKDLKPLAKEFNMKLLRNKEKNAHKLEKELPFLKRIEEEQH